ncbi:MAG TPA: hypothetical protein VGH57_32235 [Amycolatopsis sp.]
MFPVQWPAPGLDRSSKPRQPDRITRHQLPDVLSISAVTLAELSAGPQHVGSPESWPRAGRRGGGSPT